MQQVSHVPFTGIFEERYVGWTGLADWNSQLRGVTTEFGDDFSFPLTFDDNGVMRGLLACECPALPLACQRERFFVGVAREAFNAVPKTSIEEIEQVSEIHFYIDGSSSEEGDTTWALTALAIDSVWIDAEFPEIVIGIVGGDVVLSRYHPHFIGAEEATTFAAEASALTWALQVAYMWMKKVAWRGRPKYSFFYDNKAAGCTTFEFWTPSSEVPLANINCGMATALRFCAEVSFAHVKSHTGHRWNEFVDGVAKSMWKDRSSVAHSRRVFTALFEAPAKGWTKDHRIALWAYYAVLDGPERWQYPPGPADGGVIFAGKATFDGQPQLDASTIASKVDDPKLAADAEIGVRVRMCEWKLLSTNVLTLKTAKAQRQWTQLLRRQECILAAACESRDLLTGVDVACPRYFVVASAATKAKRQYGCRLRVSKLIPYAKDGEGNGVCFLERHINIVLGEPRLLVVTLCAKNLRLFCIVAHVPHKAHEAEVRRFWKHVTRVCQPYVKTHAVLLFMDANCEVPAGTSVTGERGVRKPGK